MSDLELSERWHGLDDVSEETERRRNLMFHELKREIAKGHELSGLVMRVEAFFEASDDVIVRLLDDSFALVHPTWIRKADRPPWPQAERLGRGAQASEAVRRWEEASW
ncbi:MAG: hypothetical protein ACRYG2_37445 [Janthinobacterium lividum]